MSERAQASRVRYTTEIAGVQEVTLYGAAELDYWRRLLALRGMTPAAVDGAAHVVISASTLVWQGIHFRELIVTVATCSEPGRPPDSFYLAAGFNTSRPLTWAERYLFGTPYAHAAVALDIAAPAFELRRPTTLIRATMAPPRAAEDWSDEPWAGPVFLPPGKRSSAQLYFWVALRGRQGIVPFAAGHDRFELDAAAPIPVVRWLAASGFAPREWRVRAAATHARSRTLRRARPAGS